MDIKNNFLMQMSDPDIVNLMQAYNNKLALNFNCIRVGIVQEFYPANLTAKIKIASKRVMKINADGTQTVRDYAPIIAKVLYSSPYQTHPLFPGDEVVLLFNDRELETWFINGQANVQNHERMHDLTDAIAVVGGIRSIPRMIEILLDCYHLFYGESDIQMKAEEIISNTPDLTFNVENTIETNSDKLIENVDSSTELTSPEVKVEAETSTDLTSPSITVTASEVINVTAPNTNYTGNVTASATITGNVLVDATAATGVFMSADGKKITVVNGIVRSIQSQS